MSQVVTVPRPETPIAGTTRVVPEYWRFFDGLVRRVGRGGVAPSSIKLIGSPGTKTFTADIPGTVYVAGGSSVSLTFRRGDVDVSISGTSVRLAIGDQCVISYNAIPTATWVPD